MSNNNNQPGERSSTNFRIKVCGMTSIEQLHQLGEIGVQFAGLHFYQKSPQYVLNYLTGEAVKHEKLKVFKIGVFVNATHDEIIKQVDDFGLDMVQLSGNETPYFCSTVSNYVSVIKGFRFVENDHMEWILKDYYADCDMFLFDSSAIAYDTKQRAFNWRKLAGRNIGKPFFVNGAIIPADAVNITRLSKDKVAKDLFAVDIGAEFDDEAGMKNIKLIKDFIDHLEGTTS